MQARQMCTSKLPSPMGMCARFQIDPLPQSFREKVSSLLSCVPRHFALERVRSATVLVLVRGLV